MRYDNLRSVAGRIQTVVGDVVMQGERIQALLSWRDPRATATFIIFCLISTVTLCVTPSRLLYRLPTAVLLLVLIFLWSSTTTIISGNIIHLELHRSWIAHSKERSCSGREIFVYHLPLKFNKDLRAQCNDMVSWMDLCNHMVNGGLGQPMPRVGNHWYQTHQYSLEPIFLSRALNHPCRVHNANQAKLFYVPYYAALTS
ncbi:hypothetical protein MLD38_027782 [Melastoma candidum]|uniref:Uncharacterized protein n=1 Tax=Melastoma candidum TaxID=119954 RepID=A0ACB9P5V7_9MYRT|nr:hypothetical protein MLD38_027782 [Melastoma candidum]